MMLSADFLRKICWQGIACSNKTYCTGQGQAEVEQSIFELNLHYKSLRGDDKNAKTLCLKTNTSMNL